MIGAGRIADPAHNWRRLRENSVRFIVADRAEKDERLYLMPMIRTHEKDLSLRRRFDTIHIYEIYETTFPRIPAFPASSAPGGQERNR